ncbi:hypothetical protein QUF56_04295 [Ureibacillus composti]|nr:hypothetical protein [Ureibacillus composti]
MKFRAIFKLMVIFALLLSYLTSASKYAFASQLVENEYLQYSLSSEGRFTIGTSGGNPASSLDNYKKLIYGHPDPHTSYTTLNIDGVSYPFTPTTIPVINYANLTSTASQNINNLKITQELSIVKNENTNKEDIVQIRYIVTNNDTNSHQLGMRIMMDTMLGGNDAAPFRIPGVGAVTTETEFIGDTIPQYWQAFDDLINPTVISHGTFFNSGMLNKPDKVQFTNWSNVFSTMWNYNVVNSYNNGDSAVSIIWDNEEIQPGVTKEFITYYGISDFEQDLRPPLTLSVTGTSTVQATEEGYSPNPFTITAYVSNIGNAVAQNVNLSLELPEGLSLLPGQEENGSLGDIGINGEKQVSWDVSIDDTDQYRSLDYTVNLTAANTESKTLSRTILIPPLLPIDYISLTPKDMVLSPGDTKQLSVTAFMKNGTTEDVTAAEKGTTYSSSNPELVSVNSDGKIIVEETAITDTTVYIRAYYNGEMDTATIKINKVDEKSLIEIITDPIPSALEQGKTHQISGIMAIWSDSSETEVGSEVSFESSEPTKIIVSTSGLIEAVPGATGSSYIYVKYGGKSIRTLVTLITPPTIESIELSSAIPAILEQNGSYQISDVLANWSDGTQTTITSGLTYESSDTNKVTVSSTGLIEAVPGAIGSSYISVKYEGKSIRTLVALEELPIPLGIALSESIPASMPQGGSYQIKDVLVNWSNGTQTPVTTGLTYESSAPTKLTVSSTGLIEAIPGAIGSSYISVKYEGKSIRTLVALEEPPTPLGIALSEPIPATIPHAGNYQIKDVLVNWSNGTQTPVTTGITYESSAPTKLTVSSTGLIEAIPGAIGSSYISVKYEGKSIRALVALEEPPTPLNIELSEPIPATIPHAGNYQIKDVLVNWSNGTQTPVTTGITYESSAPTKLTVSSTGLIQAIPGAIGSSYISVKYEGKSIRTLVALEALPTPLSIELSESIPATIPHAGNYQIKDVLVNWSNGTQTPVTTGITYESSAPTKLTVSPTGLIEAIPGAIGSSYISVKYEGKSIRTLMALEGPPTPLSIELSESLPATIPQGGNYQIKDVLVNWSNGIQTPVTTGITYESSAPTKLTVSSTGLIEALPGVIGSAYIYVKYGGKSYRSLVRIND